MEPLAMLNNDMSRLIMQSKGLFEVWNDSAAEKMRSDCVDDITNSFKSYCSNMNEHFRTYMIAQKRIEEAMRELTKMCNNL